MKLKNRVAVVTGAAGGLGLAFSRALLKEGAIVTLTDLTLEGLERAGESLADFPGRVFLEPLDVTHKAQVESVMKSVYDRQGRIDVLVNAAGGSLFTPKKLAEIEEKDWDLVLDVNLKGTFFCCQAAVPYMIQNQYGRIINTSSIGGRTASIVTGVAYAAAKGGLLSFTRRLALEVGKDKITVNAIAPGTVLSGQRMIDLWNELSETQQQETLSSIPLGRLSTAEEQANVVVFLASDDSSYMTGSVVDINGGRLMA